MSTSQKKKKKKLGILRYDLKNRRIYLVGEVIRGMSRLVEKAIYLMQKKDPRAPIGMFLSSDGGSYPESLEIYQIILNSRARIDVMVADKAFSGASLILQAGKKRIAFPEAKIGFHRFIYTRRGRPVEKILELFNLGAQFTARTAKKLHLIDEIIKAKRRPK